MTHYPLGEQLAQAMPLGVIGEPFTIDELDKHPDAKRIWRTIQEVVLHYEYMTSDLIYTQREYDEGGDRAYSVGWDEGYEEARADLDEESYNKGYEQGVKDAKQA